MGGKGKERRRSKRHKATKCILEAGEATFLSFLKEPEVNVYPMVDLSEHGCQFLSTGGMAMGLKLALTIRMPSTPDPLEIIGKVVWSRILEKKIKGKILFRIGVEFLKMKKPVKERLSYVLASGLLESPDIQRYM